jgi:hypothetical protein
MDVAADMMFEATVPIWLARAVELSVPPLDHVAVVLPSRDGTVPPVDQVEDVLPSVEGTVPPEDHVAVVLPNCEVSDPDEVQP